MVSLSITVLEFMECGTIGNKMKLCYDEFVSNSANEERLPPILFLHGMFVSKKTWMVVGPAIAKKTGRKAYALDARNHGNSPRSADMNYDVLTTDVIEFMDQHNIQKALIVGHSMGGRTAMNVALKHPERVEAIIVEDMTPRNVQSTSSSLVKMFLDMGLETIRSYPSEMRLEDVRREFLHSMIDFVDNKYLDAEKVRTNFVLESLPIIRKGDTFDVEFNIDAVVSMLQSNALVQDLPDKNLIYEGNSLFLCGSKSFFRLEMDSTVRQLFPGYMIKKIGGAGHIIHMESPEVYTEIVSEFILHKDLPRAKY